MDQNFGRKTYGVEYKLGRNFGVKFFQNRSKKFVVKVVNLLDDFLMCNVRFDDYYFSVCRRNVNSITQIQNYELTSD